MSSRGVILMFDDCENRLKQNSFYGPCSNLTFVTQALAMRYPDWQLCSYLVCYVERLQGVIGPELPALRSVCRVVNTKDPSKQSADNMIYRIAYSKMRQLFNPITKKFVVPVTLVIISGDGDFQPLTQMVQACGGHAIVVSNPATVARYDWNPSCEFQDLYLVGKGNLDQFVSGQACTPGVLSSADRLSYDVRCPDHPYCHNPQACPFVHSDDPSLEEKLSEVCVNYQYDDCYWERCPYQHVKQEGYRVPVREFTVCRHFLVRKGQCLYPDCRFVHPREVFNLINNPPIPPLNKSVKIITLSKTVSAAKVCKYNETNKTCPRIHCSFSHPNVFRSRVCKDFMSYKGCKRRPNCKFAHVGSSGICRKRICEKTCGKHHVQPRKQQTAVNAWILRGARSRNKQN